ncbi:MAG: VCBS repeat domain-containing M23 family metallopeptidase [Hamadaea sp.]|nr:VCBS repeat domain-containing M23 family metallopeptidase [Hamadaea sp.]NUT03118.1 VCBS repeat domain-containing M23 family metallopeptidase [Hamadaea sp.]
MFRPSLRTLARVLLAAVLVVSASALPAPVSAAGTRPLFQLPFPCGDRWLMDTYPGHGDYKIDMTHSSGNSLGRAILASASGTVSFAGWGDSGGWWVMIDHGGGWQTQYLHMQYAPSVSQGQWVARGQRIGYVGSTGDSTGPHLHYVQYRDGARTEAYFNGVPSGMTTDYSAARYITSYNGCSQPGEVSDFNGDGRADVIGVDSGGDMLFYPNNGGVFGATVQIGQGWGTFRQVMAADFSGDGHADILGVDSGGYFWYYPNNGNAISTTTRRQLGQGWGTFKFVMAADFSGDGHADILGVDSSGDLWYYPNNGNAISTTTRVQLGQGWGTFKHVFAADFSGDGQSDVLGVDSGGYLWYYPKNGTTISTSTRVQLGQGWGTFKHVFASDFSGDGHADILGVDSGGYLRYYPNNGNAISSATSKQIGQGWGTFKQVM